MAASASAPVTRRWGRLRWENFLRNWHCAAALTSFAASLPVPLSVSVCLSVCLKGLRAVAHCAGAFNLSDALGHAPDRAGRTTHRPRAICRRHISTCFVGRCRRESLSLSSDSSRLPSKHKRQTAETETETAKGRETITIHVIHQIKQTRKALRTVSVNP